MNERQRYIATLRFQKPDRVPFAPGHGRRSTLAAWHQQGLPAEVTDYHAVVRRELGLPDDVISSQTAVDPGVVFTMIPEFEEKIIERRSGQAGGSGGTLIVQDWKGNICEISDQFDARDLRGAPDFVTRRWIKLPVESRADWVDMARRYDAGDPRRFPPDFSRRAEQLRQRDYPSGLCISGPFWQLREWVGFEGLCLLLLDDPAFAQEMIDFWRDYVAQLLTRTFAAYVPDFVTFNEDMAYKEKPMISPTMCRQFLLPCWRTWAQLCHQAGVQVVEIDSDGHVGQLIPLWVEAGMNCNSPLEVAAGNDLPEYRSRHGQSMAYRGGVDKRAMAKGGSVLRQEIDRLRPVIEAGGYIPGCDHGVPPDVSWPNYLEYCRLLAQATGWL